MGASLLALAKSIYYACTQYCIKHEHHAYLSTVCQQLQKITQLTVFAALIKPSTTNQAKCLHT